MRVGTAYFTPLPAPAGLRHPRRGVARAICTSSRARRSAAAARRRAADGAGGGVAERGVGGTGWGGGAVGLAAGTWLKLGEIGGHVERKLKRR